jgi:hypothetical protein
MPGEFLKDGIEQIDSDATENALAQFIIQTLNRVEGIDSDRATRAMGQWQAIQNATLEETEFCKLAGRMGLNPYDPEEMTEDLAYFFEEMLTDTENLLVRDLTETAKPESIKAQWRWVKETGQALHLRPRSIELPFELPFGSSSPANYGYELARWVRRSADAVDHPIESVETTAAAAIGKPFQVVHRNSIPGQEIKAIVGQSDADTLVAAGPELRLPTSQRFMNARSLFHALATTERSQRLVTVAHSWDQKASRAFAAEFLAPRDALLNRLAGSTADSEARGNLEQEFQVSSYVIQRQLENAGVPISSD